VKPFAKTTKSAGIGRSLLKSSSLSVVEEDGTKEIRNLGDYTNRRL
jgi:hypothetical protein